MNSGPLEMLSPPAPGPARMLLGLTGWMDGGNVSTGTLEWFSKSLAACPLAHVAPDDYQILGFPGSMELAALLRPHTRIVDGLIAEYVPTTSVAYYAPDVRLVLLSLREPNFRWDACAETVFTLARRCDVKELYFIGSVGGGVPHTREPRLHATVSEPELRAELADAGVHFTNYEGPASFSTHLLRAAPACGVRMIGLVVEIPAYVQGVNPKGIETAARFLAARLGVSLPLTELRGAATVWEERVNHALEEKPELVEHIRRLEEDYDHEVFDSQFGDLKQWLEDKGIRVD